MDREVQERPLSVLAQVGGSPSRHRPGQAKPATRRVADGERMNPLGGATRSRRCRRRRAPGRRGLHDSPSRGPGGPEARPETRAANPDYLGNPSGASLVVEQYSQLYGGFIGSESQPTRHEHHIPRRSHHEESRNRHPRCVHSGPPGCLALGPLVILHGYRAWWLDIFYAVIAIATIGGIISHYRTARQNGGTHGQHGHIEPS